MTMYKSCWLFHFGLVVYCCVSFIVGVFFVISVKK